jgi:hypothetical protein
MMRKIENELLAKILDVHGGMDHWNGLQQSRSDNCERRRPVLCGGRPAMVVPTATVNRMGTERGNNGDSARRSPPAPHASAFGSRPM